MNSFTTALPRIIVGAAGFPVGAWCVAGAYENGADFAGIVGGGAFASIVVACWFLPSIARSTTWTLALVCYTMLIPGTAFVLVNSIGYAAKHRSSNVGTAQNAMDAHDRASADLKRLEAELAIMQANPKKLGEPHPRWLATAGCSNATVPESDAYCRDVKRAQAEMATARDALRQPRPLTADPAADSLRKLIGMTPGEINEWWPIWAALISELMATGCVTVAFAPIAKRDTKPKSEPVETEPTWLSETGGKVPFGRYSKQQPFGRVDGRSLVWLPKRAVNEN